MTPDRRLLAGALALAVVAAACGATIESPITGVVTPAPTLQGGQSTAGPGQGGQPSGGPSGYGNSTTAPGSPALERQLPDAVGAETFAKTSYSGSGAGLAGAPFTSNALDPFLKENGKTIANIAWAVGTGSARSTVMAIEVAGVDAAKTMTVLGPGATALSTATVAGKTVRTGGAPGFWVVLYPKGDILFWVQCPDSNQLDAIVAALP